MSAPSMDRARRGVGVAALQRHLALLGVPSPPRHMLEPALVEMPPSGPVKGWAKHWAQLLRDRVQRHRDLPAREPSVRVQCIACDERSWGPADGTDECPACGALLEIEKGDVVGAMADPAAGWPR